MLRLPSKTPAPTSTGAVPLRLRRLAAADVESFTDFTFPYFRPLLREAPATALALGLETTHDEPQAAGLLLATLRPGHSGRLHSIFVTPAWRAQGHAGRLLAAFEAAAREAGCRSIGCTYAADVPTAPALERAFLRCGWQPPVDRHELITLSDPAIGAAPWLRAARLPPHLEIAPWSEVAPAQAASLRLLAGQPGWHARELDPASFPDAPHTASLALRRGETIVGWLLLHAAGADTLRYTSLFVHPSERRHAPHIALLAHAIQQQCNDVSVTGRGRAIFMLGLGNAAMRRLVARRLGPYLASRHLSRGAAKMLSPLGVTE